MDPIQLTIKGRGADRNPANRFAPIDLVRDEEWDPREDAAPATEFLRDTSRSIFATNDSPDVGFEASINPYRGCEHGCIYCYARPTHEYASMSAGLDFETKILVKMNAPELLRAELMSKRWKPQNLAISGVTDCYQPVERRLRIMRRCIEVLAEFANPLHIITKSHLVTRDIDLLAPMARENLAAVFISVTTLDPELSARMEPRAASPNRRLDAIRELTSAGIPVGVMVAPIIPGLTDHETADILHAAAEAGASMAGYVVLRLPGAVAPLFEEWLGHHFPDRKKKVLNRIRDLRQGKLNDPNFGSRMRGDGPFAEHMKTMFELAKRKAGLTAKLNLTCEKFHRPGGQLSLFE